MWRCNVSIDFFTVLLTLILTSRQLTCQQTEGNFIRKKYLFDYKKDVNPTSHRGVNDSVN